MSEESEVTVGEEPAEGEEGADIPDYDLEMLRRLEADLQHTHTETLQTFTDLSGAAGRLLGFTGTTLAVIVGAAALVDDVSAVITIWNAGGFCLILVSALLTIVGHRSRQISTGFSREEFERALAVETVEKDRGDGDVQYQPSGDAPFDEGTYLIWAARNYTRWIEDALEENASKSRELFIARILYASGVVLLIVGTLLPLY